MLSASDASNGPSRPIKEVERAAEAPHPREMETAQEPICGGSRCRFARVDGSQTSSNAMPLGAQRRHGPWIDLGSIGRNGMTTDFCWRARNCASII
jgi:hypothetical protein